MSYLNRLIFWVICTCWPALSSTETRLFTSAACSTFWSSHNNILLLRHLIVGMNYGLPAWVTNIYLKATYNFYDCRKLVTARFKIVSLYLWGERNRCAVFLTCGTHWSIVFHFLTVLDCVYFRMMKCQMYDTIIVEGIVRQERLVLWNYNLLAQLVPGECHVLE